MEKEKKIRISESQHETFIDTGYCVVRGSYAVGEKVTLGFWYFEWDGDEYDMIGDFQVKELFAKVVAVQKDWPASSHSLVVAARI